MAGSKLGATAPRAAEAATRAVSLGKAGEEAWNGLAGAHRLERRRGVAICVAGGGDALAEARRRLGERAPEVELIRPGSGTLDAVLALGRRHSVSVDGRLPVAWIEAKGDTWSDEKHLAKVWAPALKRLNQARENLAEGGPVFVVLAGPKALLRIAARAPDLFSVAGPISDLGDGVEAVRGPAGPIEWLHISDLHVRAPGDWQQDGVLAALLRDLPGLLDRAGAKPRLVFVTGDIAWSGKKVEFEGAELFLRDVMDRLGLDPRQDLFVVPGNHDVDRARIGKMALAHQEKLLVAKDDAFRAELSEALGDGEVMGIHGGRLAEYCEFTGRLLGPARAAARDRPFRTDVRDVGGLRVGIASLASAWLCGPGDESNGSVVVGERQARELLDELADADLRVVLVHHPLRWWREEDQATAELVRQRAHLVLHGHVHTADLESRLTPSARVIISGAGAAYSGPKRGWPHGFQVGCLDPTRAELAVHAFTFSDRQGGFWAPDPGVDPKAPDGILRVPFAIESIAAAVPPDPGALASRLARAAASIYGRVRFIGMPAHAPKPDAGIHDLFVPVQFADDGRPNPDLGWESVPSLNPASSDGVENDSEAGRAASGKVTLAGLEAALLTARWDDRSVRARVVVLGDPGTGKSTLCRYLAVRAADIAGGPAPLVLVLREYMRQAGTGGLPGLLAFLAGEARSVLSLPVDETALRRLCDEGRAVLIVDGFDEVPPAARERVRDMVAALEHAYPKLGILATSRMAGYDEAPLPRSKFRHLRLEPFDDDALDAFVGRWYAVAEPVDARERERRTADLREALRAEPRAKELARNPLFATLIALVHQFEARLPGERAQLYELCVHMLIVTWPQAAGRRFADARLDEGRQRALLEGLALQIQETRSTDADLLVDRPALVTLVVQLLRERASERTEAEDRRLVEDWLDYLAEGTGILIEQKPGVFGFFHLSLMEYLAGQALLAREGARGDQALADFVAEHHARAQWGETLLLMLGSRASRASLAELVAAKLLDARSAASSKAATGTTTCAFLLGLLREEVDVQPRTRGEILGGCARVALNLGPYAAQVGLAARLGDILRFGKRHGTGAWDWLSARLATATGEELLGAALLAHVACENARQRFRDQVASYQERFRSAVERRAEPDRTDAAGALLVMWPTEPFGTWAASAASREAALGWACASPFEQALPRSLGLAGDTPPLAPPAVRACHTAALVLRAAEIARVSAAAARRAHRLPREGGTGLPAAVRWTWKKGDLLATAALVPAWTPPSAQAAPALQVSRDFSRAFYQDFSRAFSLDLSRDFSLDLSVALSRHAFYRDSSLAFSHDFSLALSRAFSLDFFRDFSLAFSHDFSHDFSRDFSRDLSRDFSRDYDVPLPPVLTPEHAPTRETKEAERRVLILTVADTFDGALFAAGNPKEIEDATLVVAARAQNRWIHTFFEPLAARTADIERDPESHALLLALGLAQFQTTWEWPAGQRWAGWLGGGPPGNWLAAYFWHACWMVGQPNEARHRANAAACLDRGNFPELVQLLRAHPIEPTPPDVLALFDVRGETA